MTFVASHNHAHDNSCVNNVLSPLRLNVRWFTQQRTFFMKMRRSKGAAMENNCAIDQTELENLSYEFSDEALEIAATGGEKPCGNVTLYYYYCTAVYFCPAP